MPWKTTIKRARQARRAGKRPTTQASEFVHEEIQKVRSGKHGVRSPRQAIAIGLSQARRAGVKLSPPAKGRTSENTRRQAERDIARAKKGPRKPSRKRSQARAKVLKREPTSTVSHRALSKQARSASARRRSARAGTKRSSRSSGSSRGSRSLRGRRLTSAERLKPRESVS
jgi:Family of unknown function (DUF6496)